MINQINETILTPREPRKIQTIRPLSSTQIAQYHTEGFVMIPNFFDPEELEPLRLECDQDPHIKGSQTSVIDAQGRTFKVATWNDLGNTMLGIIPRMARLIDATEALLGEECYHWHSKIIRKQPQSNSAVGFHQDYWFWYHDGCLFPNLLTCTIAIDKQTQENGCLQIAKKSHLMGRLDHFQSGNDYCTDPERVAKILARLEKVYCEMEIGDALFFHSNTLHWSDGNFSNLPRTVLHCSYNAVSNAPFWIEGQEHHQYSPIQKLSDSVLKEGSYDSIFEKHQFHVVETDDKSGVSIFRRQHNLTSHKASLE
ncbi:phytanoyl-CoA dioxygenase family protein [Crocosphaera sp. XPORK-15E]|uniref:phytanoyl-CoA dioxygenase family protein n=1 Tax=Crocosphaera sp. XPORK-15E TaxID=3110247 RepID=UPI002B1EEF1C|nr:phytanoyl-CoA dioxygenase family protein [Crocosphaera sp. XPORK-15E]MEA5536954.1 phytanoyl-CoA dioxygenase family protein [Crocosphaera sp. XPORK-15E]